VVTGLLVAGLLVAVWARGRSVSAVDAAHDNERLASSVKLPASLTATKREDVPYETEGSLRHPAGWTLYTTYAVAPGTSFRATAAGVRRQLAGWSCQLFIGVQGIEDNLYCQRGGAVYDISAFNWNPSRGTHGPFRRAIVSADAHRVFGE
jgi:hypothetical protein